MVGGFRLKLSEILARLWKKTFNFAGGINLLTELCN